LLEINFGFADSFIYGRFPFYLISPISNITDPGNYTIKIVLTDNNKNPLLNTYFMPLTVLPLPSVEIWEYRNELKKIKNNKKAIMDASKIQKAKIAKISSNGEVTIRFMQEMIVPANISVIDDKALEINPELS
jgi:hypothetical protein